MTKRRPKSKAGGSRPTSRSDPKAPRARTTVRGEGSISATDAKNRFGEVLKAAERGPVFIDKRGRHQAVVLGIDAYKALLARHQAPDEQRLEALREEFNELYARMQTDKARAVTDRFLAASDEEINRAIAPRD
jgi:prevent-host-death family protein